MSATALHLKYRPSRLERIIGHESAVQRLQGIVKSGKYPNALLFLGPSSAGKTTLARCFAAAVLDTDNVDSHPDYMEHNAGANGKIDDIREVCEVAKLSPQRGKKRIIVLDESHALTGAAADLFLKPLESPPKNTIFILCSMEPDKFNTGKGRALANRCSQFMLEAHPRENILKFIARIAKNEKMDYLDKKLANKIVDNCNGELRTAASLVESLAQYAANLEKGEKVTEEALGEVLKSMETADDKVAVRILIGAYARKYSLCQLALLDSSDSYALINKMMWLNTFMLNNYVLKGERHSKVWKNKWNEQLLNLVSKTGEKDNWLQRNQLTVYAAAQSTLVRIRQQAASFLVPENNLIGAEIYNLIAHLKALSK